MSKKGIQRKKLPAEGELTVLDFADALTPRGKARKGITLHIIKSPLDMESLSEDGLESNRKGRKSRSKHEEDVSHVYSDYHIDIWFLISEHISPEDVCRFSLICKKTDAVVSSAKFWYNLYHRHYNPLLQIPEKLKPDCLKRIGGLRCNVIRSLFYTYPDFVARLAKPSLDTDKLIRLECVANWYRQEDKIWVFCYRFRSNIKTRKRQKTLPLNDTEEDGNFDAFLAQFNNIFENPDEGCHLLIIFERRFIPFPNFKGEKVFLNSVRKPLAKDLRNYNLELKFTNYKDEVRAVVTYDSVCKFRVISWWEPDYTLFSGLI